MKYVFILAGVLCLSFMLLPACAPDPDPGPEVAPEPVFDHVAEESAVRKVEERIIAAWNAHDAKAVCANLDEDVETWDGSIRGRAALEKVYEEVFAGRYENFQGKLLDEIGIVFVTPQVAIYKARYETSGRLDEAGNVLPTERILYARVYVKKNGKWLGAHRNFLRPIEE